jgi:hypothetical protein
MQKDYTIIDNALPRLTFNKLCDIFFARDFPWYFLEHSAFDKELSSNNYSYSFYNLILNNRNGNTWEPAYTLCSSALDVILSDYYDNINLIRIRAGMHTSHSENVIDDPHVDLKTPHTVALLYLNDTDAPTRLYTNGETIKIKSKANRCVIFNGNIMHSSTKQTDPSRRITINYNFTGDLL